VTGGPPDRRDPFELPPPRRVEPLPVRAAEKGLIGCSWTVFGCVALVFVLLLFDVLTWPVDVLAPDARGGWRWTLFAACVVLALAVRAIWRDVAANRRAGPAEGWAPVSRRALAAALVCAALLFAAWMQQRPLTATAARPRVWPDTSVEGIRVALTTRWQGDSVLVALRVACPGGVDCVSNRSFTVWLAGPGGTPFTGIYPYQFVPDGPGRYLGTGGIKPYGGWYGRREYLASTRWELSTKPAPPPPAGSAPADSPP
jgi:hypothetical protein